MDATQVDVIEVEISAPHTIRVMASNKTLEQADGFIGMAVQRRGVERHFYIAVPAGRYHSGDLWEQEHVDDTHHDAGKAVGLGDARERD